MPYHGIEIPGQTIVEFCRSRHIRRLSPFGWILRDAFGSDSDVDVLVEFDPGATPGFGFSGIQEELATIPGRKADLNRPGFLSKYFRDEALREAEALYDAA